MVIKLSAVAAFVAVSICSVIRADAAESDNYLSLDAGLLGKPKTVRILDGTETLDASVPSKHEIIWGFSFGHELNRNFALEAGYRDLGELSGSFAPGSLSGQGNFRFTAKGPTLALVGVLPFGRWEAYGKLGTMIANTEVTVDGPGVPYLRRSTWNAAALGELGIRFRMTSQWDIGLAEAAFGPLGDRNITGSMRRRATTLAVRFHF